MRINGQLLNFLGNSMRKLARAKKVLLGYKTNRKNISSGLSKINEKSWSPVYAKRFLYHFKVSGYLIFLPVPHLSNQFSYSVLV